MKFQIGAMSVGDILDRGLKVLFSRLPTFYAINLIVLSPLLLLQLALPKLLESEESPAAALGGAMVVLVLALILSPIGTAAILHVISQEFINRRAGIAEAFRFALNRFGSLLFGSFVFVMAVGLGLAACCVPGLIFLSWWGLFSQVIVVEGRGAAESFTRSKQLTEGYRLRLLGIFALFWILQVITQGGVTLGLESVLPSHETVVRQMETVQYKAQGPVSWGNYLTNLGVTYLLSILVGTYVSVCLTLFYYDLRIRKEGYDLELAAQEQAAAV
jgi:hypothetical protein